MIYSATDTYSYSNYASSAARGQSIAPAESLKSQPAIKVIDPAQTSSSTSQTVNRSEATQANRSSEPVSQNANANQMQATNSNDRQNEQAVQQVVNQLKARDSEVRSHEMAHLAAAGGYATSGASFAYQVGPDGKRYAIGGEVGIDISPVSGDPQATLQKAMVVQRAALAPAQPSDQDLRVASAAVQMAAQARMELAQQDSTQETSAEMASETEGSGTASESESGRTGLSDQDGARNQINESQSNAGSTSLQASRNAFDLRLSFQQGA
ncbi:putative metalloprotease CJM1_0395 family protein [Thiomicrorhabdus sp.]|uniref:putative metalloprotease CJM1_0395 family protein n=1 Tax=Thiomicrorhabdus sp. TaxID=2039724 RepID=UPI00356A55D2